MRNAVTEPEARRAVNQIWNGAGDHNFVPDFKAYDAEAHAELYWNTVIGAVRKHYDYAQIEPVFLSFQEHEDADAYELLLWLGLENAVYGRELRDRPALEELRREYAARYLAGLDLRFDSPWYEKLSAAHFSRVLGKPFPLDKRSEALLDELEFSPELDTEEILTRAKALFAKWLQISLEQRPKRKGLVFPVFPKRKAVKARYRPFGAGFADRPQHSYGASKADGGELQEYKTTLSGAQLRSFMEAKYGRSMFSPEETQQLERELCTGKHERAHLLITRGEKGSDKIQNGFEALKRQQEEAQIRRNRAYCMAHSTQNSTAILALTAKIQNSVLLHLRPTAVRSPAGLLRADRAWRAPVLNEERIFERTEQDDMGGVSVDLLLDASTSQENRLETISNQAFVIAESLDRCGIPCRISSFCSMTGYTIVHIFRDYAEKGKNERVFDYVANGCNRDGLAIRALCRLMRTNSSEHRMLVVLSDVKPNDALKMPGIGDEEFVSYNAEAGLSDTAQEVRRARAEGIAVVCVFTGEDEDVPSARLVYERDFARIRSVTQLADAVGKLIQNQIGSL